MHAISNYQAVKGAPLTQSRFISMALVRIINAGIFANSTQEAAAEARRIYKRNCGGMYKKVQADSRKILRTCEANGISIEKPYVIKNDGAYRTLYVIWYDGQLCPIKSVRRV